MRYEVFISSMRGIITRRHLAEIARLLTVVLLLLDRVVAVSAEVAPGSTAKGRRSARNHDVLIEAAPELAFELQVVFRFRFLVLKQTSGCFRCLSSYFRQIRNFGPRILGKLEFKFQVLRAQ